MKNTNKLLLIFILLSSFSGAFSQTFNKSTDLLIANFDLKPDDDDVQAAAALASILKHPDYDSVNYYAVAGAYGDQEGYTFISAAVPDFFTTLFGSENVKWTNADGNWSASVTRVKDVLVEVLNAGGKVFVQEAGQSDFTYDVVQAAMVDGISLATISSNVILVQHSNWNKNNTTTTKMNWLIANVVYVKIEDGNTAGNGTPAYKDTDTKWMPLAMALDNPNGYAQKYWTMADEICDNWTIYNNPAIRDGGVDFSDCSENWYIFNWGTDGMTVESFWDMFVTNDIGDADFAPTVSIVTPTHYQYIDVGADVPVEVSATDDDSISKVKLYLNDTLVSEKITAPYTWTSDSALLNMAAGTYILKAVAEDTAGQTSEVSISIIVRIPLGPSSGPEVGSNYIVCEIENTDSDLGLWEIQTPGDANYFDPVGEISPISNTHVEFTGNNAAGSGSDRSPLDYTFTCPKTAQYELYMRMHQRLDGEPADRCNDVYIRMAGNFTSGHALISTDGLKEDQKFFGKGSNWGVGYRIDMIINGEEKRFPARYNLIEGEEYTFTISGRSKQTNLDYWILIDNSEDFAPVAQDDMAELYDAKYRPTNVIRDTIPVTGLTVSPASATLNFIGKTQQLTATLSPANVSFPTVVWSSSDDGIATVSASGLVRAQGAGTAVITVTSDDGGFTDSCSIISLAEPKPEIVVSGYYQIIKLNTSVCLYAGADNIMKEGDPITLFTYQKDDSSMVWAEQDHGDGYYSYQKINTNFCIDAGDGGANNQAALISECDQENYNQHWKKEELASGNIRLKKRDVDFVLNGGAGATVGQEVNLWKSSVSSGNLEWTFDPAFEETVSLSITVIDTVSSLALSGVDVTLNNETKQTEADGKVIFSDLEFPGTFTYALSKDGYISKGGDIEITKDTTLTVSMVALLSGIKEEHEFSVNIYPNPASDYLIIEAEKELSRVDIISIDGQLILSQKVVGSLSKIELPVETQSLLFVKVVLKDGSEITKKVMSNPVGSY